MRKLKITLTDKFVILFIAMGALAAGAVSITAYILARDALMKRTFDQLTSVKSVKKEQMEHFFEDRFEDLEYLTDFISHSLKSTTAQSAALDNDYIINYINSSKFYDKYYYINTQNAGGKENIYPHNLLQETSPFVKDMNYFKNGKPLKLIFGAPVIVNNVKAGMLVVETNTESINDIMLNKNPGTGLGESGESYLVGSDYLMRSNSRFADSTVMKVMVRTIGVARAMQGRSGTDVFPDYRGIDVLSSYCRLEIPDLEWVLMAEIDLKEAMAPIDKIRNYILFLAVSISILVFVLAYLISRKISRPLQTLTAATGRIGQGDFDVFVEVDSGDEIGDLTESFNLMSSQLREKDQALSRQRLIQSTIETDAQDTERERLSRELHDGIGQSMIAIKLKLEQFFDSCSTGSGEMVQYIRDSIDSSIEEIRNMSNNLAPSVLSVFGLENAVRKLCNDMQEYADYDIDFIYEYPYKIDDKKSKTYLYRIVQEALNNIQKHSGADKVTLTILHDNGALKLTISDNGKGFSNVAGTAGNGAGLYNMTERAKILGGCLEIDSEEGYGVTLVLTVPDSNLADSN